MHLGHKVTIALIAFVLMMSFLVYKTTTIDYNLVADDYYQKELEHQDVIDATINTNSLNGKVKLEFMPAALGITFPEEISGKIEKLSVTFFRPSDVKLDKTFALGNVEENETVIDITTMVTGNYQIQMNWMIGNEAYYYEESVYVN